MNFLNLFNTLEVPSLVLYVLPSSDLSLTYFYSAVVFATWYLSNTCVSSYIMNTLKITFYDLFVFMISVHRTASDKEQFSNIFNLVYAYFSKKRNYLAFVSNFFHNLVSLIILPAKVVHLTLAQTYKLILFMVTCNMAQ
jgi:hypothetical protein